MASGSKRPTVEVLISTYEERVLAVHERLPPPCPGTAWLVSHQTPSGRAFDVRSLCERPDVRYFCWADNGTSKNRNQALRMARGEICLVSDDDVEFLPGWADEVTSAFRTRPGAAFATFISLSVDRQHRKESYPPEARPHNRDSIGDVSEIEIAFRLDAVRELQVTFDERIGPGNPIALGEGYFFLRNILARGGLGWQIPLPIVRHMSATSSGERGWATLSRDYVRAQSAFSFSRSGYRSFLSIPKHTAWLAARDRQWFRIPEFAWNTSVGALMAARLRLADPFHTGCK